MHRLSAGDRNNPLWHDAAIGEEKLLSAWHVLARRYCGGAWNVLGADIFNEPWAASCELTTPLFAYNAPQPPGLGP